jgi:hypothetical protein
MKISVAARQIVSSPGTVVVLAHVRSFMVLAARSENEQREKKREKEEKL